MHFSTLVAVEIPKCNENYQENKRIQKEIDELKKEMEKDKKPSYMYEMAMESLTNRLNTFSRFVDEAIGNKMYPYYEGLDDPEFCEFEDSTEDLKEQYENDLVDCIKDVGGKILTPYEYNNKYEVIDGKVYMKNWGKLKVSKQTKRTKKMVFMPKYPIKKLYPDFNKYCEEYCYCDYDKDHEAYGRYYNPKAFYDWYQIGGRWSLRLLVKDTCKEYSYGECIFNEKEVKSVEGYRWVSAARKKDIEWDKMMELFIEEKTKSYYECKKCFEEGKLPDNIYATLKEDGIHGWGGMLYVKGETLEENLLREGATKAHKYSFIPYFYVYDNDWVSKDGYFDELEMDETLVDNSKEGDWRRCVKKQLDDLSDDTVIAIVDVHD